MLSSPRHVMRAKMVSLIAGAIAEIARFVRPLPPSSAAHPQLTGLR
jgi:hypothetical protein